MSSITPVRYGNHNKKASFLSLVDERDPLDLGHQATPSLRGYFFVYMYSGKGVVGRMFFYFGLLLLHLATGFGNGIYIHSYLEPQT
jgi:hypothetical protein